MAQKVSACGWGFALHAHPCIKPGRNELDKGPSASNHPIALAATPVSMGSARATCIPGCGAMTKNENTNLSHRLLVGFIVFGIGWDRYSLLMHQPTPPCANMT